MKREGDRKSQHVYSPRLERKKKKDKRGKTDNNKIANPSNC